MNSLAVACALVSLVLAGAIFGFFYAWGCSMMWGLDAADPKVAIPAMQSANREVQNAVFPPAFFATLVMLAATATACLVAGDRAAGMSFAVAAVVYAVGGMGVTVLGNAPLNDALAGVQVPLDDADAARVWSDYSEP